jgi:hypothetical protein
MLDYLRAHGGPAVTLALGTTPFTPKLIGLVPFGF